MRIFFLVVILLFDSCSNGNNEEGLNDRYNELRIKSFKEDSITRENARKYFDTKDSNILSEFFRSNHKSDSIYAEKKKIAVELGLFDEKSHLYDSLGKARQLGHMYELAYFNTNDSIWEIKFFEQNRIISSLEYKLKLMKLKEDAHKK